MIVLGRISKRRLKIWNTPREQLKRGKLEFVIEDWLKNLQIPFEIQYPITGIPDFFIPPKICVFVDECYWHGCNVCFQHRRRRNIDIKIDRILQEKNYIVLRFWEHEINHDLKSVMKKICLELEKIEK